MITRGLVPSPDRRRSRRAGTFRVATIVTALLAMSVASAQQATSVTAGGEASRELLDVLKRLDPAAIALIAIALLVLSLLGWRVLAMVRRERRPRRSRKGAGGRPRARSDDSLTRNSLQDVTDWGFDENKRSAVGRRKGLRQGVDGLAPLETSTQMPALDQNSLMAATPPNTLGRSPIPSVSPYRTGTNPYFFRNEAVDHRIDVEEVADVLTQAELLVQLGDPKEAMNLLSRHIRENEKPGPQVWLMLLDLYRTTGREAQYNTLADGFRALFNAAVPPWPAGRDDAERSIEDYPQVIKRTLSTWPDAECRLYLEKLLNDDRGGSRQGFTLTAYRELLFLVDILALRIVVEADEADQASIDRKLAN